MNDFTRLRVYRDAVELAASVYRFAGSLPATERYELSPQLRRCAVSVTSNVAEGAGRGDHKDFARFVRVAIGSLCELQSQLDICEVVGLGAVETIPDLRARAVSVHRQAHALHKSLRPDT